MTIPFKKTLPIIMSTTLVMASPLCAAEKTPEPIDHSVITIYQGGLALITENREIELNAEQHSLFLPDVAPETIIESLMIRFTPDDASTPTPIVTEKKLNRNQLSPQTMIQHSVGKEVMVISSFNGREKEEKATILSDNGGLLLQYKDRIELDLPENARLAFKDIPAGLNTTPVLSITLKDLPQKKSRYHAHLNYLTHGVTWNADYIAQLDDASKTLALKGWATLNNNSGIDYQNIKINLIAGDLNIVNPPVPQMRKTMMAMAADMSYESAPINTTTLGDYHLYPIADATTLQNNTQTQLSLFHKTGIPFTKSYQFENNSPHYRTHLDAALEHAKVTLHVQNDEASQLGFALPNGTIRLYQHDEDLTTFIGEDRLPATPNQQSIALNIGKAFDITLKRAQTKFTLVNEDEWEISYRLTAHNGTKEPVITTIQENFFPNNEINWEIIAQNHPAKIVDSTASWEVEIPAESEKSITYTIRYTNFNGENR